MANMSYDHYFTATYILNERYGYVIKPAMQKSWREKQNKRSVEGGKIADWKIVIDICNQTSRY